MTRPETQRQPRPEGRPRKRRFEEMLPHELEAAIREAPVCFVPLGSLEFHGWTLPFGNDALKAEAICLRVAERAGGVVVPPTYWGIGGGHKAYFGSVRHQRRPRPAPGWGDRNARRELHHEEPGDCLWPGGPHSAD